MHNPEMSRYFPRLALVALAGLCTTTLAQQAILNQPVAPSRPLQQPQDRPDPSTLPSFKMDRLENNFGTIFDNERASTRVVFWNEGPGVLKILNWHGSCSCTVGDLHIEGEDPEHPAGAKLPDGTLPVVEVPVGGRGYLDVSYDPHGKTGQQSQTVTFTINDPTNPNPTFRIMANVIPLVMVEPNIINFNQIQHRQGATMDVMVMGRTEDFMVTDASVAAQDFISVEVHETVDVVQNEQGQWVPVDEPSEGAAPTGDAAEGDQAAGGAATASSRKAPEAAAPPGGDVSAGGGEQMLPIVADAQPHHLRRTRLTVRVSPDAPPGRFQGTITISTNDERRPVVSAALTGEVVGDIAVLPRVLAIGLVPANLQYERKIQVLSRGGAGFRITSIEEQSNLPEGNRHIIQYEAITNGPNQGYVITIRGKAPASLAQIQGEFIIHTTLESEPTVSVPFFGHVQGSR